MASLVYFKFKANVKTDSISFDGSAISVKDLKNAIRTKCCLYSTDLDLKLEDSSGKGRLIYFNYFPREYTKDNELIPKYTSIVVRRVPRLNTETQKRKPNASEMGLRKESLKNVVRRVLKPKQSVLPDTSKPSSNGPEQQNPIENNTSPVGTVQGQAPIKPETSAQLPEPPTLDHMRARTLPFPPKSDPSLVNNVKNYSPNKKNLPIVSNTTTGVADAPCATVIGAQGTSVVSTAPISSSNLTFSRVNAPVLPSIIGNENTALVNAMYGNSLVGMAPAATSNSLAQIAGVYPNVSLMPSGILWPQGDIPYLNNVDQNALLGQTGVFSSTSDLVAPLFGIQSRAGDDVIQGGAFPKDKLLSKEEFYQWKMQLMQQSRKISSPHASVVPEYAASDTASSRGPTPQLSYHLPSPGDVSSLLENKEFSSCDQKATQRDLIHNPSPPRKVEVEELDARTLRRLKKEQKRKLKHERKRARKAARALREAEGAAYDEADGEFHELPDGDYIETKVKHKKRKHKKKKEGSDCVPKKSKKSKKRGSSQTKPLEIC
ncbi:unnamed protein product [Dibothriocephalus latus]|uniref:DWNN domain-containing protein n=1 Tax=Dibothriocephalus latus TaxID=60516 RepID=A0A3P7LP32_DIBLA|nr:unnamed protein product [Dibothriocephalus latus]